MNLLAKRFIKVTAPFLIYTLVALSTFNPLALAQEPAPFEISITPQAEYALSGQPFTYTIAITNVSQQPLKDILVKVKMPEGSVFGESYFVNPNWFIGGAQPGQAGEVIWLTQEPVAAGEVMTFGLVVNVLPELAGKQLINDAYSVVTIDGSRLLASGPPLETQVLMPTPTPVPTVEPTGTPVPTASSSPTPLPQATPSFASPTPLPRLTLTTTAQANVQGAETSTAISQRTIANGLSTNPLVIIGIPGLILLIAGLIWFWKYR